MSRLSDTDANPTDDVIDLGVQLPDQSPTSSGPADAPAHAPAVAPADDPQAPEPDGQDRPAGPGAAAVDDAATLVAAALARIEDKLAESHRLVDRQTEITARLHAENQTLRGGELRRAQAALVLNVLRVFDDVSQMAATTEDPAARNDLSIVADALVDALARNGIDPVAVEPGDVFTASAHKIVAVEATPDAEAERTVARVVRPGFVWSDGQVVRVSDVAVFRYTEVPSATAGVDDSRPARDDRATSPDAVPVTPPEPIMRASTPAGQ